MAYTITPVAKIGNDSVTWLTGTRTLTVSTDGSNAFRNLAVGSYITVDPAGSPFSRTVSAKGAENRTKQTLSTSSGEAILPTFVSAKTFSYLNPPISDVGTWSALRTGLAAIVGYDNGKQSNAYKMNIPIMDSDSTIAMDMDGVDRTINISLEFIPAAQRIDWQASGATAQTISVLEDNLDNMIAVLESLIDGQQFTSSTIPIFTTTRPSRTYQVYFSDVKWNYPAGEPSHLIIDLSMIERGM
jgi:hypothetical protein